MLNLKRWFQQGQVITVWREIFAGVYFCGLAIFCVLRELIFAIRTDWFFLLGINFCDFQKVRAIDNTYFQAINQYFVVSE